MWPADGAQIQQGGGGTEEVGTGSGPCEDEDESLVQTTQEYTEYTEPNYRYCNSGNLLQWAKGVETGRR